MSYTGPNFNISTYSSSQIANSHRISDHAFVSNPEWERRYQNNQFIMKEGKDIGQMVRNQEFLNGNRRLFDPHNNNGFSISPGGSHTFGNQFQNNSVFNVNKSMCQPESFASQGQTIKRNLTVTNLAFNQSYESRTQKIPVLKQERSSTKNGETSVLFNPLKSLRSLNQGSCQTLPDETTETKFQQLKSYKSLRQIDSSFKEFATNEVLNGFDASNYEIPLELAELSQKLKLMKLEKQNLIKDKDRLNQQFSKISDELASYQESSIKMQEECKEFKPKEEKLKQKIERLQKMILEAKKQGKDDVEKKYSKQQDSLRLAFDLKNKDIATLNAEAFFSETHRDQAKKEVSAERQRNLTAKLAIEEAYQNEDKEKYDEVNKLKKALEIMEDKLQTALKQNKKKDEFLQQNLKSKLKVNEQKSYVSGLIRKYKSMFPKNVVAQKLAEQENEIDFLRTMIKQKNEGK